MISTPIKILVKGKIVLEPSATKSRIYLGRYYREDIQRGEARRGSRTRRGSKKPRLALENSHEFFRLKDRCL